MKNYTIKFRQIVLKLSFAMLILFSQLIVNAKEWNGITPLKSTRADVEKILGKPLYNGFFQLKDFKVSVNYKSESGCDDKTECSCLVPKDTVLWFDVTPEEYLKFSSLNLDLSKYEKTVDKVDPDLVVYSNDSEGIAYTISQEQDYVMYMIFTPTEDDCKAVENRAKTDGDRAKLKPKVEALCPSGRTNSRLWQQ